MLKKILIVVGVLLAGVAAAYWWCPEQLAKLAVDGERAKAGLSRHEIDAGGIHFVYLDGGQGAPLLLLHGFGADKDNFTRVAKYLTPHFRVIAPDLSGFGESGMAANDSYSIDEQVERVHALVQALAFKTVHIGGSSMGGEIAAVYAAKYPTGTASLWLLAPAGVRAAPPSELMTLIQRGGSNPLIAANPDEFAAVFHFVMTDPPFVPRRILDVMGRTAIAHHDLNTRIFEQVRNSPGIDALVKGMTLPTRIVWGEQDRALNVGGAQVLLGLMPGASALIMPGVGHLPMLERPREVGEDYVAFRQSLGQ